MKNEMPAEITALIDQFLRDLTRLRVGVFGLVYRTEPEPAMTIIRNRHSEDVVDQAESVFHIIRSAATDGRIDTHSVMPLN